MKTAISIPSDDTIRFQPIRSEIEDSASGPNVYELLTYPADYTLEVLVSKFDKGEIKVPKFQRRFVWTLSQASRLIESFLLGLPVPPIYLYTEKSTETLLVVDGNQRLQTIYSFFKGVFGPDRKAAFRLTLGESNQWDMKDFEGLSDEEKRRLKNCVLRAYIMKQLQPDDSTSVYHVFERLNTGGTSLTGQEVRNCVYDGTFSDLLQELNTLDSWREILGTKKPDRRYKDVEMILRFLALSFDGDNYNKPMKNFLSKFMGRYRSGKRNGEFRDLFEAVSEQVHVHLGAKPFHGGAGMNPALFDCVYVAFGNNLNRIPSDINERVKRLRNDEKFLDLISKGTTDKLTVAERIKEAGRLFA